jgi:hypothetical protein
MAPVSIVLGAVAGSSGPVSVAGPEATVVVSVSNGFAKAKKKWLQAAHVPSAVQGAYWEAAARALRTDTARRGSRAAIAALENLATLPDTNDTPTQMAEAHHDIAVLDRFFATPNPYA